jgi:hypothetical protein
MLVTGEDARKERYQSDDYSKISRRRSAKGRKPKMGRLNAATIHRRRSVLYMSTLVVRRKDRLDRITWQWRESLAL